MTTTILIILIQYSAPGWYTCYLPFLMGMIASGREHSSDGPIEMMPTKALDLLWQGRVVLSVEFGLTPAEFSASIVQLTFEPG